MKLQKLLCWSLSFLLSSAALAGKEEFIELCARPQLEEPMLLTIETLLIRAGEPGKRNLARCKRAAEFFVEVETLYLTSGQIFTLEPLQHFPLKRIYINESIDLDVQSFRYVPQLSYLGLSRMGFTDLNFLKDLPALEELIIYEPDEVTITIPKDGLKNLKSLSLERATLSNWADLGSSSKLEILNFYYPADKAAEIGGEWIRSLKQLHTVNLYNVLFDGNDLSVFTHAENLGDLTLDNVPINDVKFLAGLKKLTNLQLVNNGILSFPSLKALTELKTFYSYKNEVSSLDFIAGLKSLLYLSVRKAFIHDVTVLEEMTKLQSLYLDDNRISLAGSLGSHLDLTYLNVQGNCISDINTLNRLTNPHLNSAGDTITLYIEGKDEQKPVCD